MAGNDEQFKIVTYKRRKAIKDIICTNMLNWDFDLNSINISEEIEVESGSFDKEKVIKNIERTKSDISKGEFYESVKALLREGLGSIQKPKIDEIVCLGIGKISKDLISKCQLGLLLCLRDLYDVKVSAYDPVFTQRDISLLEHFNINILEENSGGKEKISDKKVTLVYMPHCSIYLSNNLLYANWGLNLENLVIFANSFSTIIERIHKITLQKIAEYIVNIFPHTLELMIVNNFISGGVFNDCALHFFPMEKLSLLSKDFWENCTEPECPTNCF